MKMKTKTKMKKAIAITLFGLAVIGVNAQNVEIIPKVGINIATQSIKGGDEKAKVGFQGGVGVNFHTGLSGFSIQPELNFISKGTSLKTSLGREHLNVNYLELPVLVKYSFGPVYLNVGPSLGLRLGQANKEKVAYGAMKKLDFGLQMGGGLAIPLGPGKVIIDARYVLGLTNTSAVKGANIKNRGIALSAGYAIPF